MDERVLRSLPVDLLSQLAHEDVHGPVAVRRAPAPDSLEKLVPREYATLLAHPPAVDPGEHQVEHAHVWSLVTEPREPGLAVGDADRVEAGRFEVPRHAACDDVVVLDDQDFGHPGTKLSRHRRWFGAA